MFCLFEVKGDDILTQKHSGALNLTNKTKPWGSGHSEKNSVTIAGKSKGGHSSQAASDG